MENLNINAMIVGDNLLIIPIKKVISDQTRQSIDSLLLERISMRGISRVTGVSWDWLQKYVNSKMSYILRCISIIDKSKGRLTLECDEMCSFVSSKKNKVDVWLAIDRDT
jgi:hypothetical protein